VESESQYMISPPSPSEKAASITPNTNSELPRSATNAKKEESENEYAVTPAPRLDNNKSEARENEYTVTPAVSSNPTNNVQPKESEDIYTKSPKDLDS